MVTTFIILGIFIVFVIGFIKISKTLSRVIKEIEFANEYRNKFVDFVNKYIQNNDMRSQSGNLDNHLYVWLTKNVNKIQNNLGSMGEMTFKPAGQNYFVPNYEIIINTIPRFRTGRVEAFEINSVDDCLLRYIGQHEENRKEIVPFLKNPIIWFREGFKEILSLPLLILNWFGIFKLRTVNRIKNSLIYKIIAGFLAFVSLVSGLITIILGYNQTINLINRYLEK